MHPTLNTNVRQAALALAEGGLLEAMHTSFAAGPRLSRIAALSEPVARVLEKRRVPDAVAPLTRVHPLPELRRLAARRSSLAAKLIGPPDLHRMYATFDRITARQISSRTRAVLGYEDGALATFIGAEQLGLARIYDLPIPFWRMKHALLEEEAETNPEWAPLLGGLDDPAWALDRKSAELEAADLVLTASSLSTASVREAAPGTRVVQIPYGCPEPAASIRPSARGPLRALYVGSLTQRKGLSYIFEAAEALGARVDLTLVGGGAPSGADVLHRALARHRHIPAVAHHEMAAFMRTFDVLLLPSIVEGFGLVILEALAQGLPVVATDRTGAIDLYDDETRHWIVPAADSAAIAALLERWVLDRDRLDEAKSQALDIARRTTWATYRDDLRTVVEGVISAGTPPR
ncbi:hypothetical protein GCM10025783_27960 [Amnibacterium soli]|uniref:D-inositol 3-phosphate glycosyltransferase n=2 Tax=Amnibacterium soli TaxID=1282736 RepID=A0ABP8ZD36_9MICO